MKVLLDWNAGRVGRGTMMPKFLQIQLASSEEFFSMSSLRSETENVKEKFYFTRHFVDQLFNNILFKLIFYN